MQKKYMRLVGCDGGALRGPLPGPQKMKTPRLAPGGVGRGCFMPCVALCGPLYGVLRHWNIETPPDIKTALRACKWHLQRFAIFVLLDVGAKMPPAGHWRAYKRRKAGGKYRGTSAKENPPQNSPGRASVKIFSPSPRSPSRGEAE